MFNPDNMDVHQSTDNYQDELREKFISRMEAEGYKVIYPEENQLLIDIDSYEGHSIFHRAMAAYKRNMEGFGEIKFEQRPSSSGYPHMHITVTLPFKVDPWQRIALQAAFGSDPMRELLSITRLMKGDSHPTILVEKKEDDI